jgi:hypothetical protein
MSTLPAIKSDTRPDERLNLLLSVEEARARIVGATRRLELELALESGRVIWKPS